MTNVIQWTPRRAIREALEQDGRKPAWLAEQLGWDQSRVSRILSGERRLVVEELFDIADAQGRPLDWYREPPEWETPSNRVKPGYLSHLADYHSPWSLGQLTYPVPLAVTRN